MRRFAALIKRTLSTHPYTHLASYSKTIAEPPLSTFVLITSMRHMSTPARVTIGNDRLHSSGLLWKLGETQTANLRAWFCCECCYKTISTTPQETDFQNRTAGLVAASLHNRHAQSLQCSNKKSATCVSAGTKPEKITACNTEQDVNVCRPPRLTAPLAKSLLA